MSQEKRKRVWVTGGAGFLGPHLIDRWIERNADVVAIDNFVNGRPEHLERFHGKPNFIFAEGDIRDPVFLAGVAKAHPPDLVYHLAAHHFIPYCIANPAETLLVNVVGTQRLLDALDGTPVSRFVLASTADVYATSDIPHSETDSLGSTNIYGISKLLCENLIALAQKRFPGVKFFATRFFNIFGPGETNPHVIPDILNGLKQGNVLRLGNLSPLRDYVHTSDVAEMLLKLAEYVGSERIFNVGTGVGSSVTDLLRTLEKILGRSIRVETDPAKIRPVERQYLVANISKAQEEVGWAPNISLEKGLKELVGVELSV